MDIIGKARRLESRLTRTLESAVHGVVGPAAREPIELLHAVVDAAQQQVQAGPRGRRIFPFNRIVLHLVAPARADRVRFAAYVEGPPSLRQRIVERLQASGCDARELQLDVAYAARRRPGWNADYHLDFQRVEVAPPAPVAEPQAPTPRLELTVAAGAAVRRSYSFTGGRIDIGRRTEVLDDRQRLVRTNHVAFTEQGNETNRTVSRKHAHIIYVSGSREYRLRDDGSVHGTAVLRKGHTIPVPPGTRGVRLQAGDEIVLGQAKLRVRIQEGT